MISEPSASLSWTLPRSRRSAGTSPASAASSRCSGRIPSTTSRPSYPLSAGRAATSSSAEREALAAEPRGVAAVVTLERRLDHVHGRAADEAADEEVHRPVVELLRGVDLLELALAHDRDAVAHGHGLDLVVGDVDRRRPEVVLEACDLGAGLHAQLRVEVRERLVHEEGLRPADDRAAHGDALALAAGEGARLALEEGLEAEDLRRLVHALVDLRLLLAAQLEPEGDVVVHAQVRVERVALEDHRDVAVPRRHVVDDAVADLDHALGDVLEAGEHAQGRRLAAPRGADEDHELAVVDRDVELRDGPRAVRVDLAHSVERDSGQRESPLSALSLWRGEDTTPSHFPVWAVSTLRRDGNADDRRAGGGRHRPGAARRGAPRPRPRRGRARARAPALRPLAGVAPGDGERRRARGRAGGARARARAEGGDRHAGGSRRRRQPEPHPARGDRRPRDRPHRPPHPRRRADRRRPLPHLRRPHGGRRRLRREGMARRRGRGRGRVPHRADRAAHLPRRRRVLLPPCRADEGQGLRRPEVHRLPDLRGDAEGGDGRGRRAASRGRVRAAADRRHVRAPDQLGGRAARHPGAEPRRRHPLRPRPAALRLHRRLRVAARRLQRGLHAACAHGRGRARHRAGAEREERRQPDGDDPRRRRAALAHRRRRGAHGRAARSARPRSRPSPRGSAPPTSAATPRRPSSPDEVLSRIRSKLEVWATLGEG